MSTLNYMLVKLWSWKKQKRPQYATGDWIFVEAESVLFKPLEEGLLQQLETIYYIKIH